MPYIEYIDELGDLANHYVSIQTWNNFDRQGLVSVFRSIYDFADWLRIYGTPFEHAEIQQLIQSYEDNMPNAAEGSDKMSINKQEAAILNVLNYFGELTEDQLIEKLKLLKAYNDYTEFSKAKDTLRHQWGYMNRHTKNNKIYYKAAISYGSY